MKLLEDVDRASSVPAPSARGRVEDRALYDRYLPLVRRIAMRTVRSLPSSITIDDVISAGWLGMVEALGRRTESMQEEHFEAYASYRIRGAILDYLRGLDPMSRKLRGASRKITSAITELVGRFGRTPDQDEVAVHLGITLDEYHDLLSQIGDAGFARLELGEGNEPSAGDASPEAAAARKEIVDCVATAIEQLPERLKVVVGLYYQEECSFRQIGEVMGVTESRVCQLHSEAIHLIRAVLEGKTVRKKPRKSRGAAAGSTP